MFISIITFLEALAALVTKSIPSDEVKLESMKQRQPAITGIALRRAEAAKKKTAKIKLKQLDDIAKYAEKNNLSVNDLVMYLNGDTTQSKLIEQLIKNK